VVQALLRALGEGLNFGVISYTRNLELEYWTPLAEKTLAAPPGFFVRGMALSETLSFFSRPGDFGPGGQASAVAKLVKDIAQMTPGRPTSHFRFTPAGKAIHVRAQRTSQG